MTVNCTPPSNPLNLAQYGPIADPCAMLPVLRAAWYQLMAGQAKAQVRNGDTWLTFHQGNASVLRQEILRLETMCGGAISNADIAQHARAVRAGPICNPYVTRY